MINDKSFRTMAITRILIACIGKIPKTFDIGLYTLTNVDTIGLK
tara:strand:- start:1080 stop:1211 length:132 start_codon:yes stop_codon:yes gene_type:complete